MAMAENAVGNAQPQLFLGFDCSTQSLKVTAVRQDDFSPVYNTTVDFSSLKQFNPTLHVSGDRVTQNPLMWVKALDTLLQKMQSANFPFERVVAISGSGQQHGSVYLTHGADTVLATLDASQPISEQIHSDSGHSIFATLESPIWMDSSTRSQCRDIAAAFPDGQIQVAQISGSVATERFTGPQIRKYFQSSPEIYAATERIALVSSFMCSVLAGKYAPIDAADGAGMNLMDISQLQWSPSLLAATAPNLCGKLGELVPSTKIVGLGVAGRVGATAISLGTSDTLFGVASDFKPRLTGNIQTNPIDNRQKMVLLCFKNGSLTREHAQRDLAGGNWDTFSAALNSTPPGNDGILGMHIDFPEITPMIMQTGNYYFDAATARPIDESDLSAAQKIRCVVESQCLAMRLHATKSGLPEIDCLTITGGASENADILQIISDVFGAEIKSIAQKDSASIGAALRAAWAIALNHDPSADFAKLIGKHIRHELVARPCSKAHEVYQQMLPILDACQNRLVAL